MRTALLIATTALALTGCKPKADNPSANATVGASNADETRNVNGASKTGMMDTATNSADPSLTTTSADFVKNAAISDMFEIMSSKMAVMSGTTTKIKKFAQQMVDDHTKSTRELKAARATDNETTELPTALDPEHQALIDTLRKQNGTAFDTTYKQQQIESHTKALALMKSYANGGDKPALKAFATKTAPVVAAHLKMAQEL